MSRLRFAKVATPAAPSAGNVEVFADTADGRIKQIDQYGVVGSFYTDLVPLNELVNGTFEFAQRQVLTTVTTYSNVGGRAYGADRWWMSNENASIDYAAVDTAGPVETNLVARYYGRIRKITALGKFAFGQVMEGRASSCVRGRVVRFQVKMKYSPNPMTVRLGLVQLTNAGTIDTVPITAGTYITAWGAAGTDPTLGTNLSYIAPTLADGGTIVGNAMDCVLTTAWVRYSATFTVPTNAKNIIPMIWTNGQPAVNDIVQFAEAGLYVGPEIRDWSPVPTALDLVRCQRFYWKSFAHLTAPAQTAGINTGELKWSKIVAGATASRSPVFWFAQLMRVVPTIVTFNPAAGNVQVRDETNTVDCSATATANLSDHGVQITCTGNAATVAEGTLGVHITADAEL